MTDFYSARDDLVKAVGALSELDEFEVLKSVLVNADDYTISTQFGYFNPNRDYFDDTNPMDLDFVLLNNKTGESVILTSIDFLSDISGHIRSSVDCSKLVPLIPNLIEDLKRHIDIFELTCVTQDFIDTTATVYTFLCGKHKVYGDFQIDPDTIVKSLGLTYAEVVLSVRSLMTLPKQFNYDYSVSVLYNWAASKIIVTTNSFNEID